MIYSIDSDDFLPECSNRRFPLLRAIHSEFKAAYMGEQGDKMRLSDVINHFDLQ
jgi:chitinase